MKKVYGFRASDNGLLEVIPEQAAVVKEIYRQYLSGKSLGGIADFLFEQNIPSPSGEIVWHCSNRVKHGKGICHHAPSLPENELKQAVCKMLGISEFDSEVVKERLECVHVLSDGTLVPEFVQREYQELSL